MKNATKREIEITQASVRTYLGVCLPKHFPVGTYRKIKVRVSPPWPDFEWDSCEKNYRTYKLVYDGLGNLTVERLT